MELTKDSTYSELKAWFLEQFEAGSLPQTLDSPGVYYRTVEWTAKLYISRIDAEFETHGKTQIKRSAIARAAKGNLFKMYKALQVRENWNVPQSSLRPFHNSFEGENTTKSDT